jgi:hypothetical protein
MLQRKQNRTFANYFQIFILVRNVFVCFKLLRNQNRTFVFSKNDSKMKPKRYKLRQGFLKTKQNFLLFQKKFGDEPEQKLLNQIFLVLIENVLFQSRILFQKWIYSIFFGTKATKRKLSILKERWFDIANAQYLSIKVSWPAAGLVVVVLVAYLVGRYIFSFFANMYICFARLRERMGPLRLSLTPSTVGCFPSPIPRAGYFWGGVFFCVTPHWERIFALLHYCLAKSTSKVPGRYSNREPAN